ncbi:MAG: MATE family efflux transporter [Chlamydiae bacterium]|nr:MATE family efflux transporter [Chlamydiota bacterium]
MQKHPYQLTKYPIGSIREIFTVSWPIMISLLSGSMMLFADRLMLGKFSIDALNASAIGGSAFWTVLVCPFFIAGISEVFVGQFHGKNEFEKIGNAAWQSIWFSIFVFPVFILLALILPEFIFVNSEIKQQQSLFFSILISSASFFCINAALTGFFAGQGKVKTIAIATILANILNILFDVLLIFGVWHFPKMGIKGAALGTALAQVFQIGFFSLFFFNKKNIKEYGTLNFKFNKPIFLKTIFIGAPASFAHFSEALSYFAFFSLMLKSSYENLTIAVLIQSFFFVMLFLSDGLYKGVIAISSNLIGAKKFDLVTTNIKAAMKLQFIFFLILFVSFLFLSPGFFELLINKEDLSLFQEAHFLAYLKKISFLVLLFFLTDGWMWAIMGSLTAAGDTKFIMKVGTIAPWLLNFIPIFIGVTFFNFDVLKSWIWINIWSAVMLAIYLLRYKSGRWKKLHIT